MGAVVDSLGAGSAILGAAVNARSLAFHAFGSRCTRIGSLGGNHMRVRKFFVELLDVHHVGHTSCIASNFPKNVLPRDRVVGLVLRREILGEKVDIDV